MNNLDKDYQALLQDILDNGVTKSDRTGTGTISVFGRQIRHKMSDGFPLLTTKKVHFKSVVSELLWFLSGRTDLKWLLDQDNTIWVGDAYQVYRNAYHDAEKTFQYEGSTIETRRMTKDEFIDRIKTDDEFAKKWGDLGPIYGKQWRSWKSFEHEYGEDENGDGFIGMWKGKEKIDQIQNLINELKTNPDSRRLMVNAWNVGELDQMTLPPCHYSWQVYTRELSAKERIELAGGKIQEKYPALIEQSLRVCDEREIPTRAISLMWNQRSVDFGLGAPFNIASYGLLLGIIAKEVNMVPDELIGNLGDVHLYLDHIEPIKEQLNREPYPLPTLNIFEPAIGKEISILDNLHIWSPTCFIIENYQSHPTIKLSLSN